MAKGNYKHNPILQPGLWGPDEDTWSEADTPQKIFRTPYPISLSDLERIAPMAGEFYEPLRIVQPQKFRSAERSYNLLESQILGMKLHGMANIFLTLARQWMYNENFGNPAEIFRTAWPTASNKWIERMTELMQIAKQCPNILSSMYQEWANDHHPVDTTNYSINDMRLAMLSRAVLAGEDKALKAWANYIHYYGKLDSKYRPLLLEPHTTSLFNEVNVYLQLTSQGEDVVLIKCRLDSVLIHQPLRHKDSTHGSTALVINYKLSPDRYLRHELSDIDLMQILLEMWAADAVKKRYSGVASHQLPDSKPVYARIEISKLTPPAAKYEISSLTPSVKDEEGGPDFNRGNLTLTNNQQLLGLAKLRNIAGMLYEPHLAEHIYTELRQHARDNNPLPRFHKGLEAYEYEANLWES